MSYQIYLTEIAENDINNLKKSGDKKLNNLFDELRANPYKGTGKIEQLKFFEEPTFSRRINQYHRLVYRVKEDEIIVLVLSCFGHY
jgi:toxin YoeB